MTTAITTVTITAIIIIILMVMMTIMNTMIIIYSIKIHLFVAGNSPMIFNANSFPLLSWQTNASRKRRRKKCITFTKAAAAGNSAVSAGRPGNIYREQRKIEDILVAALGGLIETRL